jgi:ATP-dependent DNA helicase RecG
MLSEEQLRALLSKLESDHVERTESVANTDKFGQAICAFANDLPNHGKPGYLLVGVRDNGALAGLQVTDQLLRLCATKGTVYIRVGPRKAVANEQEERLLTERRIAFARSFDAQPCTESKIEDLALSQFETYRREAVDPETIAANHRSVSSVLALRIQ